MEKLLAERLMAVCDKEDVEARIHENYFGRGMYDESTTGIVVDSLTELFRAVLNCPDQLVRDEEGDWNGEFEPWYDYVQNIRTDNLGNGTIVY